MVILPEIEYGGGRHIQYIEPKSNVVIGLHYNFVTQPLCLIALCLAKVSVGLFLLRVSPSTRMRYFIMGTIVFTILSATGNFRKRTNMQVHRIFGSNLYSDRVLSVSAAGLHLGYIYRGWRMYPTSEPEICCLLQLR